MPWRISRGRAFITNLAADGRGMAWTIRWPKGVRRRRSPASPADAVAAACWDFISPSPAFVRAFYFLAGGASDRRLTAYRR